MIFLSPSASSGSPPRVRSRPDIKTFRDSQTGITSACAEQTWSPRG